MGENLPGGLNSEVVGGGRGECALNVGACLWLIAINCGGRLVCMTFVASPPITRSHWPKRGRKSNQIPSRRDSCRYWIPFRLIRGSCERGKEKGTKQQRGKDGKKVVDLAYYKYTRRLKAESRMYFSIWRISILFDIIDFYNIYY